MSSRTSKKSSKWSEWTWDDANSQWYRGRIGANGKYEYDTRLENSTSDQTPRNLSDSSSNTFTPLAESGSPETYYRTEHYDYQSSAESLDDLAEGVSKVALSNFGTHVSSHQGHRSIPAYSSGAINNSSYGYSQPIPIANSSSNSGNYDYPALGSTGGYMAAHNYGQPNMANYQINASQQYPTSYNAYGNSSLSSSQASVSTIKPLYPSFSANTTVPNLAEAGDAGGSGVATPQNLTHKVIKGTEGKEEKLDSRFKIHKSKSFKPGKVFKVLWSEPSGSNPSSATDVTNYTLGETRYGQKVYSTVRRFVIVAADDGHCQCLPILTYGHQGTLKPGVKKDDHAIVYMSNGADEIPPSEVYGEYLTKLPIRIIPKTPRDKLDSESRINYAKVYTVEHNVKVLFIGEIAPGSKQTLITDFDAAWYAKRQMSPA